MLIEYLTFIVTFIVTAGLSVIGILTAYQLYHNGKKPAFLILLYQQIFLISFFIYGIWGNLVLREIISDIEISPALTVKLAIFIPVLGLPFLTASWFMLLKFGFMINKKRLPNFILLSVLLFIVSIAILLVTLVQKGVIKIEGNPDLFIVRILLISNLLIHIFLLLAFVLRKQKMEEIDETGFGFKQFLIYLAGVGLYTALLSIFNVFGFISSCFSILILFAISILIPVIIKFNLKNEIAESIESGEIIGFEDFCRFYEISKREAEIIREICSGKSNKAISEKLFITLQTVKDHTHHIYTKTEVSSRIQLANLVREKTGELL
ncbi:MAG: response regulator transcription factor [Draconibacterium sp.]